MDGEPCEAVNVEIGQLTQVEELVAAVVVLNVPKSQSRHDVEAEESWYSPGEQAVQEEEPSTGEKYPGSQSTHVFEFCAPIEADAVPEPQSMHDDEPSES